MRREASWLLLPPPVLVLVLVLVLPPLLLLLSCVVMLRDTSPVRPGALTALLYAQVKTLTVNCGAERWA
jgi:hypothetical protein